MPTGIVLSYYSYNPLWAVHRGVGICGSRLYRRTGTIFVSSKARRGTESNRSCSDSIDDASNLFWPSMSTIRNPENLFVDNYDLLQYSP